jgi:hypothetical protein
MIYLTGAAASGADALAAALGGETCDMTGMDEKVNWHRRARHLPGENLEVVLAEFSTLS